MDVGEAVVTQQPRIRVRDGADIAPDKIARSQDALDAADASIDPDAIDELALDDTDDGADEDDDGD